MPSLEQAAETAAVTGTDIQATRCRHAIRRMIRFPHSVVSPSGADHMRAGWGVFALAALLASCRPGTPGNSPTAPDTIGYPRCAASNADGHQVACPASPRAYNGDGCACADGRGHTFWGRVQEYPPR